MHTRFPDLANGWADCVQIWCVARDPLDKCFTHVWGGVHLHVRLGWSASARAHVHTPLPYLANGWADCVQTWCVANDPLDERLTQVRCRVHLHVRTCTPPSNDGASSPARPSPIKASYWYFGISEVGSIQGKHVLSQTKLKLNNPFQLVTGDCSPIERTIARPGRIAVVPIVLSS